MKPRNMVLPAKVESYPLSDKSKLLWERYHGPMQSAAHALNQAITNTQNLLAGILLEMEGYSPETHVFDIDKMCIRPRPQAMKRDNGAT